MIGTGPVFDDELDRRRGERVQVRMRVNTLIRSGSLALSRTGLYSLYQRSLYDIRTNIQIQELHPSVTADETVMRLHYGTQE